MYTFIGDLKREVDKKLKQTLSSDLNILKKSLEATSIYSDAFKRLKEFISGYTFKDEAEEIHFFKEIKPQFFYRLIYYRKVYHIEMDRPYGIESQRQYLIDEIKSINRYNSKRSDFVHYYRSGSTHLDSLFYVRGHAATAVYLETFHYERDPLFSTNCDFMVACILANELLLSYLTEQLDFLDQSPMDRLLPRVRITWQASKADLNEQIFAWSGKKVFGDIPQTQLFNYIQRVFNIELDTNISRTFEDLRIRNKRTPFLDELKESLIKQMDRSRKRWKSIDK